MRARVRRILALSIVLALLVGILPPTAAEDRSMEEIVLFNTDFERGDDTWWDVSGVPYNSVSRNLNDPHNIVAITRRSFIQLPYRDGSTHYIYVVTALNRLQRESAPAKCKVNL